MAKILIVDDQKSILLTLEALLKSDGHTVTACTNALDATKTLAAETFDLVITDAIMPGGNDGYTLIKAIRRHPVLAKMPVILLTGKREKVDVEKGIESGATDYVVKPIDPEFLLVKVRHLLPAGSVAKTDFVSAAVSYKGSWELKTEITAISELGFDIVTSIPLPIGKI
ncbi:MAG TPA: response regulator, partial [Bdellovibrio sp.]